MSVWSNLMRGLSAFREAYLASDAKHVEDFESLDARQNRYMINWSMYENNAYSGVHQWATSLKHQAALYKYIRGIYNPTYRLGDFYASHLLAGALDMEAEGAGAIPIETESDRVRQALATLWRDSNFNILKDIISLRGTVQGDVFLEVVDDTDKERVYLRWVEPETVVDLVKDDYGNVKEYVIEEERIDPENAQSDAIFRLEVTRENDWVVYRTFKDNNPYGWNGQPAEWQEQYTFTPFVQIQHRNMGLKFGWSEIHAMRGKIYEIDDLASVVSDQMRKAANPVWLMKGISQDSITLSGSEPTDDEPQPGREELKAIWNASPDADTQPLVGDLNLGQALDHINNMLEEVERDCPELSHDIWNVSSQASGRALRLARQKVETRVLQRRENYDTGLVDAFGMAMSIGGMRNYEGYESFNLDSYWRGDLDHRIAQRPVFKPDEMDSAEISQELWTAAKTATEAGASLGGFLMNAGLSDEEIENLLMESEDELTLASAQDDVE